jgi:hypothetical protein
MRFRNDVGVDRLIVGTSGSPGSLQALRYGEGLAARDALLVPVIAWELPGGDRVHRAGPAGELGKVCAELAYQQLRGAMIAVWGGVPDDPRVQSHVERDRQAGCWLTWPAALAMCWSWVLAAGER